MTGKVKLIHTFQEVPPVLWGKDWKDRRISWPVVNQATMGKDTDFAFTIMCYPGGVTASLHAHKWDELYFILEGELVVEVGKEEKYFMKYHDTLYIPRGVPHRARNFGTKDTLVHTIHCPLPKGIGESYVQARAEDLARTFDNWDEVEQAGRAR